jgi:hypothetical protein
MKALKSTVTSILKLSAPLLFMAGCGAADEGLSDEELSQVNESIINGTVVTGEETEGVVKLTDLGCSGTLVTNSWVLTAKHCVSGLQSVHIEHQKATGVTDQITVTNTATNVILHPSVDVALVHMPSTFTISGSTDGIFNTAILQADTSLVNKTVKCSGYGRNTLTTGFGTLRTANLNVSNVSGGIVTTVPNSSSQIQWKGDSGSTCFYNENGYKWMIGVQSFCNVSQDANGNVTSVNSCGLVSAASVRDWIDNAMFSSWESLGGGLTSAVASTSTGKGKVHAFARGGDNAIWFRNWDNGWSGWTSAGGGATSAPSAASQGAGKFAVFARGGDNGLWMRKSTNGVFTADWCSLGGGLNSGPAAVSQAAGKLMVFALGGDNGIWYRVQSSDGTCSDGSWSNWTSLGGTWTHNPAAFSWGGNQAHVFARDSSGQYQYKYFNGTTWDAAWTNLGGNFKYGPAVAYAGSNKVELFGVNQDGTIAHRRWHGLWATTWANEGGTANEAPGVSSWGNGRIDLFSRGTDNGLWHRAHPW